MGHIGSWHRDSNPCIDALVGRILFNERHHTSSHPDFTHMHEFVFPLPASFSNNSLSFGRHGDTRLPLSFLWHYAQFTQSMAQSANRHHSTTTSAP